MRRDWLQHLHLLKQAIRSEIWMLTGIEGCGKTSTAIGIAKTLEQELGWTWTFDLDIEADVLIIDDVEIVSKREAMGKSGKLLFKFLRMVRTLYSLVLVTAPSVDDTDKSLRESQLLEIVLVVRPGFAVWRYPIIVTPSWRDDYQRRRKIAIALSDQLKKVT